MGKDLLPLILLTAVSGVTCAWFVRVIGIRRLVRSFFAGIRYNVAAAKVAQWKVADINGWNYDKLKEISPYHIECFSVDQAKSFWERFVSVGSGRAGDIVGKWFVVTTVSADLSKLSLTPASATMLLSVLLRPQDIKQREDARALQERYPHLQLITFANERGQPITLSTSNTEADLCDNVTTGDLSNRQIGVVGATVVGYFLQSR